MRLRDLGSIIKENPDIAVEYVVLEYDDKTGLQKVVIGIKQDPAVGPNIGRDIVRLLGNRPTEGAEANSVVGE